MSTRAQIRIEGLEPMLYVHCDGYPHTEHGILAHLKPFIESFKDRRGWDAPYMLARLTQHMTNQRNPDGVIGFGIDCHRHTDIEYLYTIKMDWSITVQGGW